MLKIYVVAIAMILLTACNSTKPNSVSSHSDLTISEAEKAGYVVSGPGGLSGVEKLEEFYHKFQNRIKSQLSIARYTDEGDPLFIDLDFNGESIKYTYDNSWDKFGGQEKGVKATNCEVITTRTGLYGETYGTQFLLNKCNDDIGYSDPEQKEYLLLFVTQKQ
ncbi:DUF4362 domain-containing protein [Cohnella endophytica]|uniref:DUF4362 domain-containing protein n=1 Tax=Cohnella endophytica TaxID=2419778 RepID=A0A494XZ70_9BACL|nr:DUF4362 domain-containing protein [Cohnella endophytica]RKP55048.1 DUF4362 domain-containing protein [Cohnella endophytica]